VFVTLNVITPISPESEHSILVGVTVKSGGNISSTSIVASQLLASITVISYVPATVTSKIGLL